MRRLTHINGLALTTIFPGTTLEGVVKIVSYDSGAQPKNTLTDLPGADGAIPSTPYRDVRRITIRGLVGGDPLADDEPMRVLKRIFRIGLSASDTITLGFTDNNFPGAGPHWTIAALVSDELTFQQQEVNLWQWQVILTAADPDYIGRSFAYALDEGYTIMGRAYGKTFPFTYGGMIYVNSLTVFLEGSVASPMQATIAGPSVNPKIRNVTTGEELRITATLAATDEIEIDSNGIIKLNGQYKNSLREIGTRMPRLVPGVNTVLFSDDTDPLLGAATASATLAYTTRDA